MRELYVGFLLFLLTFLYLSHLKREVNEASYGFQETRAIEAVRKSQSPGKKIRHG